MYVVVELDVLVAVFEEKPCEFCCELVVWFAYFFQRLFEGFVAYVFKACGFALVFGCDLVSDLYHFVNG